LHPQIYRHEVPRLEPSEQGEQLIALGGRERQMHPVAFRRLLPPVFEAELPFVSYRHFKSARSAGGSRAVEKIVGTLVRIECDVVALLKKGMGGQ
jgi:hypothetical protein